MSKQCEACGCIFTPRPQTPHQAYCRSPECQRERRRRWQQQKRRDDADYRENDSRASKSWAAENPAYLTGSWKKTMNSVCSTTFPVFIGLSGDDARLRSLLDSTKKDHPATVKDKSIYWGATGNRPAVRQQLLGFASVAAFHLSVGSDGTGVQQVRVDRPLAVLSPAFSAAKSKSTPSMSPVTRSPPLPDFSIELLTKDLRQ